MKTTPETRAELRRLLGVTTPRPWRENIMLIPDGQSLTAIVSGRPNPDDLRVVGSALHEPDGLLMIASANALADLLDDLDAADETYPEQPRHLIEERDNLAAAIIPHLQRVKNVPLGGDLRPLAREIATTMRSSGLPVVHIFLPHCPREDCTVVGHHFHWRDDGSAGTHFPSGGSACDVDGIITTRCYTTRKDGGE